MICSGSDRPNVSADASAVQIASALAASALVIIPRQCQSGMRRKLFDQKVVEGFATFGVPPSVRVLMPIVVKASAGSRQPELLRGRLPTEHKHHAVTESGVDHALSATDIDIIRQ